MFQHTHIVASTVLPRALEMLSCFTSEAVHPNLGLPRLSSSLAQWKAPGLHEVKLNTDASFSSTGAGYGFVLRNSAGEVLKSGAGPLSHILSAEHAEIMALWRSLEHLTEFWNQPLLCETDCLRLTQQIA